MSSIQDNTGTPIYKILFTAGGLLLFFFAVMHFIVLKQNRKLGISYQKLESSDLLRFGTLTEYHILNKDSGVLHVYTYKVPDNSGELHEISESVDRITQRKLRVGDTVAVKIGIFKLFGKETILSRIIGNKAPVNDYSFLDRFSFAGILFAGFLLLTGLFKRYKP